MPQLQAHQLRVAAVGSLICDSFRDKINKQEIVAAGLLHDMGNILKFDLTLFPEYLQPQGLVYWERVKQEYRQKYGKDEHQASVRIAQELGVPPRVVELVDRVGFLEDKINAATDKYDQKICAYADMRVNPWGVVSLEERFADLRKRYNGERALTPPQEVLMFEESLRTIQRQIFEKANLSPSEITNQAIAPVFQQLENFTL